MIYTLAGIRPDAPPSAVRAATDTDRRAPFTLAAPDSIDRSPLPDTGHHLFEATAPQSEGTLDARFMFDDNPGIVVRRAATSPDVIQLPPRTVTAGSQTVTNTIRMDSVMRLQGWAYRLLRGGMRSTIITPELQSELDTAGAANVMPSAGIGPIQRIMPPAPWYEQYTQTIGR